MTACLPGMCVALPISLRHCYLIILPCPHVSNLPWPPSYKDPCDYISGPPQRIQDNLPISVSLTWSHLQSPFDHIRELICKSWDQDVDIFGAVIQPSTEPTSRRAGNSVLWSPHSFSLQWDRSSRWNGTEMSELLLSLRLQSPWQLRVGAESC